MVGHSFKLVVYERMFLLIKTKMADGFQDHKNERTENVTYLLIHDIIL